jgi:hypothetical protein
MIDKMHQDHEMKQMTRSRFVRRRAANSTPVLVFIFFAACPLLIPGFSLASGCEAPTKVVSALLGTSGQPVNTSEQPHEYKILLRPPNYENLSATQEHLVFATLLTRMLFDEAASRSHRRCNIIASTSLFPNIRVVIHGSLEPQCSETVRDILSSFTPSVELIDKIALSLAGEKKADAINSAGYMAEAENILNEALKHIYEEGSVMHALVSVRAGNFESISASSFVQWLQNQRSDGNMVLAPLDICKSDEEISKAHPSNGDMPYSNIIPPQALALTVPQPTQPRRLSHVVILGGKPRPVNTPLRSAATRKYCNRENTFLSAIENHSFVARTRCLVEVIRNTDTWVTLFCDPRDCPSEDMAEKVAATIANDAELVEFGKASAVNYQVRGPYIIKVMNTSN